MSVVDEIEIELTANAKKANTSIDNLVNKLDVLSGSLSKIDGSRLSGLANGVTKLGIATKTLSGVKDTDYNRIAKGFERFAKIDTSKFSTLSSGLNLLAKGMNAIGSVQNLGNITPSINAIKNLARVDMSGFDSSKLQSIANTMSSFATQMSSVGKIEGSVTRLVSAMARLSSSGQYIGNVATYFPQLGNQVVSLVGKLSSAGAIDSSIAKIVDGIARLASAGKKVQDTVASLDKLGDGVVNLLNRLKNAPQINANIANTIQGLGNLASSGSRISTVSNSATTGSNKLGNALKNLKGRIQGAHKSSKGFASSIGMFYAKFFLVIRAVKKFGEALGSAQDYIEEFNYFSVALDKIGKDSANQFKKAGYNSAEEYAKSFRSRFSKLQTQLTGYKVDYDTGDATSQMTHNLGLDLTEVMRFNAAIAQITNSAGMLGETSIMTSKALTMLSADWSSLSNQDLSDVMNNMQSAIVGQSRAVYKFGLDITSAGLAQTALNHGIKVNIKDLDQQSKMQLRALTMLEQSKVAYGDLARTINQPANQLRMLQAGFQNLARTIGSLFMPIVQKLYPYLNAMVMVLQEFAQWIAKLAGIKLGDISGSVKTPETPDYSGAVDDSGKVADNMDKTAKKAKKASDNLQGFDVINKLQKNDSDTDAGAGNGKPNNTSLDLSKELEKALGNYEKIWDKAFKSNQNKAVQLAKKIKKALIDGWKKGDFTEIGKSLAEWINKGLNKVPWSKIKATTKKIAKSIATFLNGFIKNLNWKLLGKNLGESLNTFVETGYTFFTTFDWLKFGTSIKNGITSAINTFDAKKAGKLLGAKLRGVVQFAFGLIVGFEYKTLGKKIGDYINGFLEDMGKVDTRTGLTGWQELGKTISDGITGILDTIDVALSTVKWGEVGKGIGEFIGNIEWTKILAKVGKVIANALFSAVKVAISSFASDPLGFANLFISVATVIFSWKKLKGLKAIFSAVFGKGIVEGIRGSSGIDNALANKVSSLSTNPKVKSAYKKLGKVFSGWMALEIEGIAIKQAGIGFQQLGKALNDKNIENFGIGVDGFGDTLTKLLTFDFAGAGKNIANGFNAVVEAFTDKNETSAKEAGTEKGYKVNKEVQENAEQYKRLEKTYGKKAAENFLNKLPTDIKKATKELIEATNATGKFEANLRRLTKGSAAPNLRALNTQFKQGKISASSYNAILKKSYRSLTHYNGVVVSAENAQKYMNGDLSKFTKISVPMLSSLKKLGVSQASMDKVTKTLNTSLRNGEISFEDYKKIVDKSYGSTEELYSSIKKISGKKITAEVKADIKGESDVKKLKNTINLLKDKTVMAKIKAGDTKGLDKLMKKLGNFSNKQISAVISPKLRKNWATATAKKIQSDWAKIKTPNITVGVKAVSAATQTESGKKLSDAASKKYKELYNKANKGGGLYTASNGVLNIPTITKKKSKYYSSYKKLLEFCQKNGIMASAYETGGFPTTGQLFVARESGPELVGKMGNRTTVANNEQITQGFADGITKVLAPAVHAAVKAGVKEVLSEMPIGGTGDVYLDGVKVTREVMSTANKISKSKGITWKMA